MITSHEKIPKSQSFRTFSFVTRRFSGLISEDFNEIDKNLYEEYCFGGRRELISIVGRYNAGPCRVEVQKNVVLGFLTYFCPHIQRLNKVCLSFERLR